MTETKNQKPNKLKSYVINHPRLLKIARHIHFPTVYKIIKKKVYSELDKKIDSKKLMVDIGGGYSFKRHWKVMDYSTKHYVFVNGVVDYNFDLASGKPFPFETESVTLFYTSHTIEHILQKHIPHIFKEIFRCLKPEGTVRITTPDFEKARNAFRKNEIDFFWKEGSIEERFLLSFAGLFVDEHPAKLNENFNRMSLEELGNFYCNKITDTHVKQHHHEIHVNWWTYTKLEKQLHEAGFSNVYRSSELHSKFPEMRIKGLFDASHPEISLFVEAVK